VSELVNPAPFLLTVKEAYERWLFHGERLAHIEDLTTAADNGLEAWIRPSEPSTVIGRSVLGDWLVDPVVFDCALQMLLLWQRYRWDTTGLPSRYAVLHRFSAPGSRRLRCRLVVAPGSTAALIRGTLAFWDEAGNLVWLLEEMECAASKALNRLTTAVL
jgi:hypothetical protein